MNHLKIIRTVCFIYFLELTAILIVDFNPVALQRKEHKLMAQKQDWKQQKEEKRRENCIQNHEVEFIQRSKSKDN